MTTQEEKALQSPVSMTFNKLALYREDWSLEEIIVFEKLLLVRKRVYCPRFHHTDVRLRQECRLGRRKFQAVLDQLVTRHMLIIEQLGDRGAKFYSFNEKYILAHPEKIYQLDPSVIDLLTLKERKAYYKKFFNIVFTNSTLKVSLKKHRGSKLSDCQCIPDDYLQNEQILN